MNPQYSDQQLQQLDMYHSIGFGLAFLVGLYMCKYVFQKYDGTTGKNVQRKMKIMSILYTLWTFLESVNFGIVANFYPRPAELATMFHILYKYTVFIFLYTMYLLTSITIQRLEIVLTGNRLRRYLYGANIGIRLLGVVGLVLVMVKPEWESVYVACIALNTLFSTVVDVSINTTVARYTYRIKRNIAQAQDSKHTQELKHGLRVLIGLMSVTFLTDVLTTTLFLFKYDLPPQFSML